MKKIQFVYKDDNDNLLDKDTVPILYSVKGDTGDSGSAYRGTGTDSIGTGIKQPIADGDYYLNLTDGIIYAYSRSTKTWTSIGSDYTDYRYQQAINDMIGNSADYPDLAKLSCVNIWCQNLVAQTALINKLFAKTITLQDGGVIQSANYKEESTTIKLFVSYRIEDAYGETIAEGTDLQTVIDNACVIKSVSYESTDPLINVLPKFGGFTYLILSDENGNELFNHYIDYDGSFDVYCSDDYIEGDVEVRDYTGYVDWYPYNMKMSNITNFTIDTSKKYTYFETFDDADPIYLTAENYEQINAEGFKFTSDGSMVAVDAKLTNMTAKGGTFNSITVSGDSSFEGDINAKNASFYNGVKRNFIQLTETACSTFKSKVINYNTGLYDASGLMLFYQKTGWFSGISASANIFNIVFGDGFIAINTYYNKAVSYDNVTLMGSLTQGYWIINSLSNAVSDNYNYLSFVVDSDNNWYYYNGINSSTSSYSTTGSIANTSKLTITMTY